MKVVMVSKACVSGAYQTKLEAIGQTPDIDLTVVVPPSWGEAGGNLTLESSHTNGYRLQVEPIRFNGKHHLHYYPGLPKLLRDIKPDIVHMDEEPYSFVTWHGMRHARKAGAKVLFFSWQNIYRDYPPPFRWIEQKVLAWSRYGIMGNAAADQIWRRKGFTGDSMVLPQFGVTPSLFTPRGARSAAQFVIGSASRRLNPEKGVDLILRAAARLPGNWQIKIAGDGGARAELEKLADDLSIKERVQFVGKIGSEDVPAFLRQLDVMVLPSRTLPTWKEQFGRVIIESMACEVPVIGSDSGEIPNVIGDAGLVFPEDDVDALYEHLYMLQQSTAAREQLGKKGRAWALANYTQSQIAGKTVAIYHAIMRE